MSQNQFELARTYTRRAIHDAVGGDLRSYLPRNQGQVVCSCFTEPLNQYAPKVVSVGDGPKVVESARQWASQNKAIPIFIKRKVNTWEYIGAFAVERYSKKATDIEPLTEDAKRVITGALFLREFIQ